MIILSVHLLTFNHSQYIEETIHSILKQKVDFKFEIVVGDDCSSDNTLEIIEKYAKKYPILFQIKRNESQLGILKNFKATLDRCSGVYVFDIAGDDMLKSEYALQKMVDLLKSDSSLGFVDSGVDKFYEENTSFKKFSNKKLLEATKDDYKKNTLLGLTSPIGICYNKDHLYEYVDFETYIAKEITIDDYPILVDLIMNTNFETIKESLHIYRVHDGSYSHKRTFESHYFLTDQMKTLFDYFSKKYQFNEDLVEKYHVNYKKRLLYLAGYFEKKSIGKKMYFIIKSKGIRDYIHYYASQYPLFRKLISIL